jgi:hypothetical protein
MKNGGTGTAETTIIRGVFAAIELELIVEGHFRPERESLTKKLTLLIPYMRRTMLVWISYIKFSAKCLSI